MTTKSLGVVNCPARLAALSQSRTAWFRALSLVDSASPRRDCNRFAARALRLRPGGPGSLEDPYVVHVCKYLYIYVI